MNDKVEALNAERKRKWLIMIVKAYIKDMEKQEKGDRKKSFGQKLIQSFEALLD